MSASLEAMMVVVSATSFAWYCSAKAWYCSAKAMAESLEAMIESLTAMSGSGLRPQNREKKVLRDEFGTSPTRVVSTQVEVEERAPRDKKKQL
jgi:CRISPR/Cas system-associated exonuclease Cas4 (RecB family)